MRNTTVDTKDKQFKVAHLYEIELATLQVISDDGCTNKIKVDDIDKCFVDEDNPQLLAFAINNITQYNVVVCKVIAINHVLSEITLNSYVTVKKGMYICETLCNNLTLPRTNISGSDKTHYLEFLHSFYGTFTGRILMTDYDIPIIVNGEKSLYTHLGENDSPLLYLPFPVTYKEVTIETKGKMNTVDITLGNIDQLMGGIMFKHNGLRRRDVIIKTIFLNDSVKSSLAYRYNTAPNQYVVPSVTTGNEPDLSLNEGFFDCVYANKNNLVVEFAGEVNSINFDDKQLSINAVVVIDDTENTLIPNRIYSRIQCPFVYKDQRCRFRSGMRLYTEINESVTTIEITTVDKFFYFEDLRTDPTLQTSIETHVIQIDSEQMLIEGFERVSEIHKKTNDQIRALKNDDDVNKRVEYVLLTTRFKLNIKQRGYNSTDAVSHAINSVVDIVFCRKTEHDCALHARSAYFGGFPSIPKNKTYGSGY